MAEYELNQLTTAQLIALAQDEGIFLIATRNAKIESKLYYVRGHFVEISYLLKRVAKGEVKQQVYYANHFPNTPFSTKYLLLYLDEILLPA